MEPTGSVLSRVPFASSSALLDSPFQSAITDYDSLA